MLKASKIPDTFSANSLKVLEKSKQEFIDKYILKLDIFKKDEKAILGQKFHNLICYYLKGFEVDKMLLDLQDCEKEIFKNVKKKLEDKQKEGKFVLFEYSFNIKEKLNDAFYYLTGRFDAVFKEKNKGKDGYIIYDWKTLNIPKNAQNDLQTSVYLYALSKIFNTNKITMRYVSLNSLEFEDIPFKSEDYYKNLIDKIVLKIYN